MREIMFRGKRCERWTEGRWAEGSLILAENFCCILENEESVHPADYPFLMGSNGVIDGMATPVDPDTVGQYTGLTDKNGKRIFEGDIIKAKIEGGNHEGFTWSNMPVDFQQGAFCLNDRSGHVFCVLGAFAPSVSLEVIGNIYDNPESCWRIETDE